MTSKEFLESNKTLLIGAVGTKINRLEQKQRWSEKNDPTYHGISYRTQQIHDLAIVLEFLKYGTFEN